MTHPNLLPLTHPQTLLDEITTPFKGDVLQRKELAIKMTGYLSRLKAGAVIAIGAPWGEGKSWFGRNWAAQLKVDNYRVVYIDAFEQDYIEDPFLLIATEFSCLFENDKNTLRDFNKKSELVLRTIMPFAAKTVVNLLGAVAFGQMGLSEKIEGAFEVGAEDVSDAAGDWITKRFENHETEKLAIKAFKENLKSFASKDQEKPIVIFVDELDRCRPDFAVKLIERIKHFFNVENVIFVLLLNREQLQVAVKGVYGESTNASNYLGKFVNFFFTLPKVGKNSELEHTRLFLRKELEKYKGLSNDFVNEFSRVACFFRLSLRDIEKALSIYVFSGQEDVGEIYHSYVVYASCLKVADPDLYRRVLKNDIAAHDLLAERLLQACKTSVTQSEINLYGYIYELHKYKTDLLKGDKIDDSNFSGSYPNIFRRFGLDGRTYLGDAFSAVNEMIDLSNF